MRRVRWSDFYEAQQLSGCGGRVFIRRRSAGIYWWLLRKSRYDARDRLPVGWITVYSLFLLSLCAYTHIYVVRYTFWWRSSANNKNASIDWSHDGDNDDDEQQKQWAAFLHKCSLQGTDSEPSTIVKRLNQYSQFATFIQTFSLMLSLAASTAVPGSELHPNVPESRLTCRCATGHATGRFCYHNAAHWEF